MAFGNGEGWELIADIFEGEFKAVGEPGGIFNGVGAIAEIFSHFGVALEMALGVLGKEFSGSVEMGVFADAGKDIEHLAAGGAGVLDTVCGDDRQAMHFREIAELLVNAILAPHEMALDLDVNVFAAENVD